MSKSLTIEIPTKRTSFLAVDPSDGKTVISHGTKLKTVLEKARKSGEVSPMIIRVPRQGRRYIY